MIPPSSNDFTAQRVDKQRRGIIYAVVCAEKWFFSPSDVPDVPLRGNGKLAWTAVYVSAGIMVVFIIPICQWISRYLSRTTLIAPRYHLENGEKRARASLCNSAIAHRSLSLSYFFNVMLIRFSSEKLIFDVIYRWHTLKTSREERKLRMYEYTWNLLNRILQPSVRFL